MTTAYTLQHEPIERWFCVWVSRAGSGEPLAVPQPRDSGTPKGRYSYASGLAKRECVLHVQLLPTGMP